MTAPTTTSATSRPGHVAMSGRGRPETQYGEPRQQHAHLSSPSAERRAIRGDDALVGHQERRRGDDEDEQEARRVARRVAHVPLQRNDRRERPNALLDIGDAPGRRRRGVLQTEEDARPRCRVVDARRGLAGHRPDEEDRGQAERHHEREEHCEHLTTGHRATVAPPVRRAPTRSACAAKAQAMPRSASAMTVSPSTKKNASVVSLDAAGITFPIAAMKSSPCTSTWRVRNATLG